MDETDDNLENLPTSTEKIAEIIENQENLPSTTQKIIENQDNQENLPNSTETTSRATIDTADESSIETQTDDNTKETTVKSIDESSKLLTPEIQKRILDIFNNEIGKNIFKPYLYKLLGYFQPYLT